MSTPRHGFTGLFALLALSLAPLAATAASAATADPELAAAVAAPERSPNFVKRDSARHPVEELTFMGLKPSMTVVELWPGGGYWTEILAPYLAAKGHYYLAFEPTG